MKRRSFFGRCIAAMAGLMGAKTAAPISQGYWVTTRKPGRGNCASHRCGCGKVTFDMQLPGRFIRTALIGSAHVFHINSYGRIEPCDGHDIRS